MIILSLNMSYKFKDHRKCNNNLNGVFFAFCHFLALCVSLKKVGRYVYVYTLQFWNERKKAELI